MKNLAVVIFVLLLVGCGGQALEVRSPDDIPSGPGVFTGEKGEVVFSAGAWKAMPDKQEPPRAVDELEVPGDDFDLFKRWQEWRTSPGMAAEREEFRQWLEYQEYRKRRALKQ